jgi:hypothetical protein
MVYYVVYKASKNIVIGAHLPTCLRTVGCRQTNKTFWKFDKALKVFKLHEMNQPIVLKGIRQVSKAQILPLAHSCVIFGVLKKWKSEKQSY